MVYVNGDSPYLLQQVQTVEPRASVQPYQGRQVIQVGTYSDEASAKRQVEALRSQGVFAEVSGASASGYPYVPPSVASSSYPYPPSGVNSAYPYPTNGANPTPADTATNLPYPPPPPGGVCQTTRISWVDLILRAVLLSRRDSRWPSGAFVIGSKGDASRNSSGRHSTEGFSPWASFGDWSFFGI